jgi:uncharacterized membrane protein YraQ (UPF0718 family)
MLTEARTTPRKAQRMVWVYVALVLIYQTTFRRVLVELPVLQNWATVFLSVVLQALPFLVLGVVLSAVIAVAVPKAWLTRALPPGARRDVPTAALAGVVLPGCECSSIPVAGRLISRGVPESAALTFLLAAPAVNPVVVVSTAVAFPGRPVMVLARFVASLATAMIVGLLWSRVPEARWLRRPEPIEDRVSAMAIATTATHDFLQAGGFLVVGAALVASLQTLAPTTWLTALGGSGPVAIVTMGGLAFALAVCSEGDAFVAAALSQFSLTSRLAFLVVGPMVDIKLVLLQAGTFGRRFAAHFAPLTFVTALGVSALVGSVLL